MSGSEAPAPLGAHDFHVLLVLSEADLYGYAIMKAVDEGEPMGKSASRRAASSTSCIVDAYQTSVWYTSAKERGSAVVLPAATPARARFLARLRTGQTCL